MKWYLKKFNQLTTRELFDIYYYRVQTYIVAQKRIYQGVDRIDLRAYHLYAINQNHQLVAYARFFTSGDNISFGRVLVIPEFRGKGFGQSLIQHLLMNIKKVYGRQRIVIMSQYDKRNFYKKFGFRIISHPLIFNKTKHVKMAR